MLKKKIILAVILLTLSLLLVYPLAVRLMQQKTEKFYFEEYIVESGDTLWSIAGEYNQPGKDIRELIYDIKKINKLDSVVIKPGQALEIPIRK